MGADRASAGSEDIDLNHYDTLGLDKSASADDVKKAYRKKASEAHPDRQDATGDMVAINRAYETLGVAERRRRYDATGEDGIPKTADEDGRDLLMTFFTEAITRNPEGDWVAHVTEMIKANLEGSGRVIAGCVLQAARFEKAAKRVKVKSGENLVLRLIEQQLTVCNQKRIAAERAKVATEKAQAMLANYDIEAVPMPPQLALDSFSVPEPGIWGGYPQ